MTFIDLSIHGHVICIICKLVLVRMKRRKGQFAGKANPEDEASASSSCDPAQSAGHGDNPRETKM